VPPPLGGAVFTRIWSAPSSRRTAASKSTRIPAVRPSTSSRASSERNRTGYTSTGHDSATAARITRALGGWRTPCRLRPRILRAAPPGAVAGSPGGVTLWHGRCAGAHIMIRDWPHVSTPPVAPWLLRRSGPRSAGCPGAVCGEGIAREAAHLPLDGPPPSLAGWRRRVCAGGKALGSSRSFPARHGEQDGMTLTPMARHAPAGRTERPIGRCSKGHPGSKIAAQNGGSRVAAQWWL